MGSCQGMDNEQIKCIDFGKLGQSLFDEVEDEEEWKRLGEEVSKAFSDIGFTYISNHGIPQEVIDKAHEVGAKFFALPNEIKSKYSKTVTTGQGFVEMDREKLSVKGHVEVRESYDVKHIDGAFPSEVEDFRGAISELIEHGKRVAYRLLRCLELGLDVPRGSLVSHHKTPFSSINGSLLRILNYPPISSDIKEGAIRCGAHTDYGVFTLLFQDNMGGLEVKNRKGHWVKADPVPGQILINVGDLLQMWTGGKFIATKHRVLVPEDEVKQRCPRKSIVMFFHPDKDTLIEPLNGNPAYQAVTAGQHLLKRYNETYAY